MIVRGNRSVKYPFYSTWKAYFLVKKKKNGIFIRAKWHFKCTCICWRISLFWKLHSRQILGNNTKAIYTPIKGWLKLRRTCMYSNFKNGNHTKEGSFPFRFIKRRNVVWSSWEGFSAKDYCFASAICSSIFSAQWGPATHLSFVAFELHSGFS